MNRAYDALPTVFKDGIVSVYGWVSSRRKYGADFKEHFEFLQSSSSELRERYAASELEEFLSRVGESSEFYRIDKGATLQDLPIIEKQHVLDNLNSIVAGIPFKTNRSSGTTGQPLEVYYSRKAFQREYAYWWYHRSFNGVQRGDSVATFAGHKVAYINRTKPPYWAMNYSENQLIFSSYHMSGSSIGSYVTALNRFKPKFIHGYPSSIYLVARQIVESGIALDFEPRMVASASETLLDYQRATIKAAFGCSPSIWYGNTELCGHVTECEYGKLHSQPSHSAFRVVDRNGNDVKPGGEGTIVATNFSNDCMPLINYNTKDRVRLSKDQSCECSRGGLILDYLVGRVEDYVLTSDGRRIGRLDHLFKDAKSILNAQIVQERPGSITIRIERGNGYDSRIEKTVYDEALRRLGKNTKVSFDYDTVIAKEKNGKFKFVLQLSQ